MFFYVIIRLFWMGGVPKMIKYDQVDSLNVYDDAI